MSSVEIQIEPTESIAVPGVPTLKVQEYRTWEDLEELRPGWNRLLASDRSAAIFLTPEWLQSWWKAYGFGRQIRSVGFLTADGELVALAPMYLERTGGVLSRRTLRFIGAGSGDSDALNILVAPGWEAQIAHAFLEYLRENKFWDVCSLETLPEESPMATALACEIARQNWTVSTRHTAHSLIQLPPSWDEYLKMLQPNFRPLLTRYPKRLQSRYQVRISRSEDIVNLAAGLERLFALHQKRWTRRGERGAFAEPARQDFYARMAAAFLERGWLEFWSLSIGDEIAATQFCFRYRDTVSLLQEGFDPRFTDDKVGYALRAHVLQQIIAQGACCYDFLGGDDPYKLKFGATRTNYLDLHFAASSARGRFEINKRNFVTRLKSWAMKHLPAQTVATLRRVLRRTHQEDRNANS